MSNINIAEVIGWKFNHQPGMKCKGNVSGTLEIVDFPGGIPSQEDQDAWTAEYDAWLLANPPREPITADKLFDTLVTKGVLNNSDRPGRP